MASLTGRSKLTKTGTTLGTPAYMAPEQLKGGEVDCRADIWAFGCVLYEMLTQRTPFEADYEQATNYGILNEHPEPVTALRSGLSLEIDRIVGKALAKDPNERYQHADELIVDLRALSKSLATATSRSTEPPPTSGWDGAPPPLAGERIVAPRDPSEAGVSKRKLRIHQVVLAATAAFALAVLILYLRQSSPEAPLRRFAISPPAPLGFGAAISPDGRHVAFTTAGAEARLWVQDLDKQQPRAIEGAQVDGETLSAPFWSPDSDFVGYESGGQLTKVPVQGGLAVRLCKLPGPLLGATWSPDGESIVFSTRDPYALHEVPAAGGVVKRILSPEEPSSGGPWGVMVRPHFLPAEAGARVVVFSFGSPRNNTLMVQDLETGRREIIGPGNFPFYSSSGHLLYQPDYYTDELWALPFSLETLTADGKAFPISGSGRRPTVAADQTLAFVDRNEARGRLVWLDRQGRETELSAQLEGGVRYATLSPDGRLIAYSSTRD
ncbi:MAG: protein kinase [Acidobacteria bacterium]|nr:protein kinase [Acidobacteriota bacterium]MDA1236951.1 protein kinase [Acidobacteriota bacterium]